MTDPLASLSAAGVAVWLDDLSRPKLTTGNLRQLVRDRCVVGVTTNPTIIQKAMADSAAYDEQIRRLALRGVDVGEALRTITVTDVRDAGVLRPVYDATGGVDARVSIEVDPRIAHDTDKTIAEAQALWWLVDRPNLFVKIPATIEGLPAISQALAEGISVNVTLIFGLGRYDAVMDAFLEGAERHRPPAATSPPSAPSRGFSSAASTPRSTPASTRSAARKRGRCAAKPRSPTPGSPMPATSRSSPASGGSASPAPAPARSGRCGHPPASRTLPTPTPAYVTELAAPGTVNTMPEATLHAVHHHAVIPTDSIRGGYGEAQHVLDALAELGVDDDDVVDTLERDGIAKFEDSWTSLIDTTTDQLQQAGAIVHPSGGAEPAGGGPSAAGR